MIEVERQTAKRFTPNNLTETKREELNKLADMILLAKNALLLYCFNNFDYFLENNLTKYDFYNYITKNHDIPLPSQVKTEVIEDVYTKLKQRKDFIRGKFYDNTLLEIDEIEYYKKDVVDGEYTIHAGAVKHIKYTKKKNDQSVFVAVMTDCRASTVEDMKVEMTRYVDKNIEELNQELAELPTKYDKIKDRVRAEKRINKSIEHFNKIKAWIENEEMFRRQFELSRARRARIIKKYNSEPIILTSKNFRARSKVEDFIDVNRNSEEKFKKTHKHSVINSFMNLGGIISGRKHLYIPIKYAEKYHGNLSDYRKNSESNSYNYQYLTIFDAKGNVYFQVTKKVVEEWPEVTDDMTVIGGDENMKHNLEMFSDGFEIDWPRKELDELAKTEIRIQEVRKKMHNIDNQIKIIKRNDEKLGHKTDFSKFVSDYKQAKNTEKQLVAHEKQIQNTLDDKVDRELVRALKHLIETYGPNVHLVFENIDGQFGSSSIKYKTSDGTEISQNKLFRLAHFGEVKDRFKRIARKYGVPVSFVPSYYTSQICPKCGHIERRNRLTQETLICQNCGEEFPADLKSSRIISILPQLAVLVESLLEPDGFGAYTSKKKLSKEKVKKIYTENSQAIVS